ncbi:MAG: branched-chain amino acid ABC transporter permease [Desulfarculaceae bacterium]|nr:branched-chain amino acid ABC transporter permease [Desulfarculaceae bacterium]MCF8046052.1 branched-chain amino acid ABC transporter permease [Desulfarculaceae bacterium]MCF8064915.1 branched-chain amino acid ABC transporter permease [Desulfarculaceae bacterium]MCF8098915.1 branched-chain amino acid ABC transporter permease [Desulfarculaceae bacterium]MCF8121224.1 branched-chain amino acid ABC transporter permease [Desulfarculaceae bacterium]
MDFSTLITTILHGLTLGMVLMLVAGGLTVIFGMLEVLNFAHGSLYMLGAYFGYSVVAFTGNFWLGLLAAPIAVGVVAFVIEFFSLRPLYGRPPLHHLLLTFGISLIVQNAIKFIWGNDIYSIEMPGFLAGATNLLGVYYPTYRLFVLVFSVILAIAIWLLISKTRWGVVVRAGTEDIETLEAHGIDTRKVFTVVFVVCAAFAAVGGAVVAPMRTVYPQMGVDIIIDAFIVVIVGGLGSIRGAVIGALIIGQAVQLGAVFLTGFADAAIYIVMAAILLFRPSGLVPATE